MLRFVIALAVVVACCALAARAGGPPVLANDACMDAIDLSSVLPDFPQSFVLSGTTISATMDSGFNGNNGCGTAITSPGVWYSLTLPGVAGFDDQNMTFTTCPEFGGSGYDTKISVFCSGCVQPVCVGGNDDGPNCAGSQSEVTVDVQAGTTYLVLVHGSGGAVGDFDLVVINNGPTLADDCLHCDGPANT